MIFIDKPIDMGVLGPAIRELDSRVVSVYLNNEDSTLYIRNEKDEDATTDAIRELVEQHHPEERRSLNTRLRDEWETIKSKVASRDIDPTSALMLAFETFLEEQAKEEATPPAVLTEPPSVTEASMLHRPVQAPGLDIAAEIINARFAEEADEEIRAVAEVPVTEDYLPLGQEEDVAPSALEILTVTRAMVNEAGIPDSVLISALIRVAAEEYARLNPPEDHDDSIRDGDSLEDAADIAC